MPDETTGTVVTDPGKTEGGTEAQTTQETGTSEQDKGFYIGTYRTREDAEHGLAEKEAEVRRAHSERDRLSAQLEQSNKLLEKLATAQKEPAATPKRKPGMTAEEYEAWKEKARQDAGEGVELTRRWLNEYTDYVESKLQEELQAVRGELGKQVGGLSERVIKASPDYQRNKEMIEELRSQGLSLESALSFAAKHGKDTSATAPRAPAPGGIGNLRGDTPTPMVSRDEQNWLEQMTGQKLTKEELDFLRERAKTSAKESR